MIGTCLALVLIAYIALSVAASLITGGMFEAGKGRTVRGRAN